MKIEVPNNRCDKYGEFHDIVGINQRSEHSRKSLWIRTAYKWLIDAQVALKSARETLQEVLDSKYYSDEQRLVAKTSYCIRKAQLDERKRLYRVITK